MFSNIIFANTGWLFLLLLIPLISYWYNQKYKQHYAPIKFSNLKSLRGKSSWRGRFRALLPLMRALAFVTLVIAMARPQLLLNEENIDAEGIDIMLSMDLSSSMLAQDLKPNRLEASKEVAIDFISRRPYDRIGLVIFAGEAATQCPLTTDHEMLSFFISALESGYLENSTAIGMGLAMAVNRLKDSPAKSKVAILLTDGLNRTGYISPETAIELAKQYNIKVYTIGVGSIGEALTPVDRRADGQYIYSLVPVEIDEALLKNIAGQTGGRYYRASSSDELRKIYASIDQLEKSKIDITAIKRKSDYFGFFIAIGAFLLILELLLRYTIFRTIP